MMSHPNRSMRDRSRRPLPAGRLAASARGWVAVLGVSMCALAGALALWGAAPALAVEGHVFSKEITGGTEHALSEPVGLGIEQSTGEVYVADKKNNDVEVFSGSGEWLASFGKKGSGKSEFKEPTEVAVENGVGGLLAGDVAVIDSVDKRVEIFKPNTNHEWAAEVTAAELNKVPAYGGEKEDLQKIEAVAFDGSGDLWMMVVKNGSHEVFERTEGGTLRWAFRPTGSFAGGLAVTTAGDVLFGNGAGVIVEGPDGGIIEGAGFGVMEQVEGGEATHTKGLAFDPVTGGAYVDRGFEVAHFPSPQSGELNRTDGFGMSGSGELSAGVGIAVSGVTHDVYVADSVEHRVDVYAPVTLASADQEAVSDITPSSAVVNGEVDPEGVAVSGCEFEYELTTGGYAKAQSCSPTPGSGSTYEKVSASLSGLAEGTQYGAVRLSVTNANGVSYAQQLRSFETPFRFEVTSAGAGAGTVQCEVYSATEPDDFKAPEPCATEYYKTIGLVRVTAVAGAGSTFEGWTVLEGPTTCNGTTEPCVVRYGHNPTEIEGPTKLVANFGGSSVKTFPLSVTVAPVGGGTVECNVGSGPGSCAGEYTENEVVNLTEKENAGYTFEGWSGECSGMGTCEVTMSEARSVTAIFKAIPKEYALKVEKVGTGKGTVISMPAGIKCEPGETECSHSFTESELVTLEESPETGSEFAGWSGCDTETAGRCEVTLSKAKSVTARFNEEVVAEDQPVFKQCVKLSKNAHREYEGKYSGKYCESSEVAGDVGSEGKYELRVPVALEGVSSVLTGKSRSVVIVTTGEGGGSQVVVCGKSTLDGTLENSGHEGRVRGTLTFERCVGKSNGKEAPCENATNVLGKPVIDTEFGEREAVTRWLGAGETRPGVVAPSGLEGFTCGTEQVAVNGALIGTLVNTTKGMSLVWSIGGPTRSQADDSYWIGGTEITAFPATHWYTGAEVETVISGIEMLKTEVKGISVRSESEGEGK